MPSQVVIAIQTLVDLPYNDAGVSLNGSRKGDDILFVVKGLFPYQEIAKPFCRSAEIRGSLICYSFLGGK